LLVWRSRIQSCCGETFHNEPSTSLVLIGAGAGALDHQDIKTFDVGHGAAGGPLEITIESGGGVEHALELPQPLLRDNISEVMIGPKSDEGVNA